MATALVAAVLNELHSAGKSRLIATWHLANDAGIAWYRRFGFVEEPDWSNARLYLRAAEQELRRFEHFGETDATKRGALIAERQRWEREVARLEKLMDDGDKAGAFASHRFSNSR